MTILGVCGGFAVTTFAAEPTTRPPQESVRLGDLDLNKSKDVSLAYIRLRWAAEKVCPMVDSAEFTLRVEGQRCVSQAIERAVESIDAPLLTSFFQSRSDTGLREAQAAEGTFR
jgi:UrcA family protein